MAGWLIAMVAPIAKRLLVALGIGIVTYTGFQLVLDQITAAIASNISGAPIVAYQFASLMGFPEVAGIILGAIASRLTIEQLKRFQLL